jgi:hypothetical protein
MTIDCLPPEDALATRPALIALLRDHRFLA